jgi:uncharacterized protein with von Willebrand factor type A (vWA) domain
MNIYMLLDRSGSMWNKWDETIDAVNAYADKVKGEAKIKLVAFDEGSYLTLRENGWEPVNPKEAPPAGGTPLYDSFIRLTNDALKDKAEKSVVVVISDGQENASKKNNFNQVKDRMELLEEVMSIPVVFIGASFDTKKANYTGTMAHDSYLSTRSFNPGEYVLGMNSLAAQTVAYAKSGVRGELYAKT